MTIDEKLDLLCGNVQSINDNVIVMKNDMAMMKGDIVELKGDVAELKSDMAEVKSDIVELKNDMAVVKSDIVELKSDMTVVKSDIVEFKSDMTVVKTDIIDLRNDMNTMEGRIDAKMEQLNENVKGIRFTIENEIRPSIALIAESHFILNRKLDEAIRVAGSIEMTRIRVSILEDDVKKLKRAVNM